MELSTDLIEPTSVLDKDRLTELAFPHLSAAQIEALAGFGNEIQISAGEAVWEAGQANMCMFVIRSGVMRIQDGRTHSEIVKHRAGGFSGDIDIITGRPSLVTAIADTDLSLIEVPGDCVRNIVNDEPGIGAILLRAFLLRRSLLQAKGDVGVLVAGSRFSPDTLRLREFLARNRYPYVWEDIEAKKDTNRLLEEFGVTEDETPIVVLPTGDLLKVPTNQELALALGVSRPIESKMYDLVVVGAGPAGLAAGVYGASEGLSTIVVDAESPGGQAGTSSRIENYMGFPLGLTGQDLAERAVAQAEKFGAQMVVSARVTGLACYPTGTHSVEIEGMGTVEARCILLAPGASYRKLEVDDLERFENRGVYYSATNVERLLCIDESVAVVGAGNSAGQAAVFMSANARKVYIVVRGSDLRATMSSYLARRVEHLSNVEVLLNSEICALHGAESLEEVTIRDKKGGTYRKEPIAAVFTMIGAIPRTDWLPASVARDEKGFILTGEGAQNSGQWSLARHPLYLETSCPGVFAAGDVRSDSVKRVASAVGEGSMSVAFVHKYMSF